MRPAVLQNGGDSLEDGAQAGKIVCAQYGRAVGGDAAVGVQDSLLAAGGRDGVRMRREQDRRKRLVPGGEGIEIPGIAADVGSGPVLLQPDAERGIAPQQIIAHAALAQRRIVDRNQLPEHPQKPLLPDHTNHPFIPQNFTRITQHHSHVRRKSQAKPKAPLSGEVFYFIYNNFCKGSTKILSSPCNQRKCVVWLPRNSRKCQKRGPAFSSAVPAEE